MRNRNDVEKHMENDRTDRTFLGECEHHRKTVGIMMIVGEF